MTLDEVISNARFASSGDFRKNKFNNEDGVREQYNRILELARSGEEVKGGPVIFIQEPIAIEDRVKGKLQTVALKAYNVNVQTGEVFPK